MPMDFAALVALGRSLTPTWTPHELLSVNGRPVRVVRFEGRFSDFHTHDVDECYVVLEGELLVDIEGEASRHVARGEAFVVRAGTKHRPLAVPTAIVLLIT